MRHRNRTAARLGIELPKFRTPVTTETRRESHCSGTCASCKGKPPANPYEQQDGRIRIAPEDV